MGICKAFVFDKKFPQSTILWGFLFGEPYGYTSMIFSAIIVSH